MCLSEDFCSSWETFLICAVIKMVLGCHLTLSFCFNDISSIIYIHNLLAPRKDMKHIECMSLYCWRDKVPWTVLVPNMPSSDAWRGWCFRTPPKALLQGILPISRCTLEHLLFPISGSSSLKPSLQWHDERDGFSVIQQSVSQLERENSHRVTVYANEPLHWTKEQLAFYSFGFFFKIILYNIIMIVPF